MSKNCYVEICYFVEALIEQERQLGGVDTRELTELGLLDDENQADSFSGQDKSLLKLYLCVYDMIGSNFDPSAFYETSQAKNQEQNKTLVHELNKTLFPSVKS